MKEVSILFYCWKTAAYCTYLINDILEQELLVVVRKLLGSNNLRLDDQNEDGVLNGARAVDPVTTGVKLSPHCFGQLPKLRYCLGAVLEQVDSLTGSGREKGRERCRESVRRSGNTLVVDDLL